MNQEIHSLGFFMNYPDINTPIRGYALRKLEGESHPYMTFFTYEMYSFQLDSVHPLTLFLSDGRRIQPNKFYLTDLGTTHWVQTLVPKDKRLLSYLLHDSATKDGGLFVAMPGDAEFKFVPMSREEVDTLLRICVIIEGAGPTEAQAIYCVVRKLGKKSWEDNKPTHKLERDRKKRHNG